MLQPINEATQEFVSTDDPEATDPRLYYQMVGAVCLDDPGSQRIDGSFKANRLFENQSESPIMAGEDRLSKYDAGILHSKSKAQLIFMPRYQQKSKQMLSARRGQGFGSGGAKAKADLKA